MHDYPLTLLDVLRRARREFGSQHIVTKVRDVMVDSTYEDFFRRVDRLAWALKDLGVKAGDVVATLCWNTSQHLELYMAITASGAVLHPINVRLSVDQIVGIVTHARDAVVFVDSAMVPELATPLRKATPGAIIVAIGGENGTRSLEYDELLGTQSDELFPYEELSEDEPAAMAYSSATTGIAKGVVYSHRALYLHTMMLGLADTWGISHSDTVLPIVPMYHVNAWGLPFAALWMGSALILPGKSPTPTVLATMLADATFAAAVPTVWMSVLEVLRDRGQKLPRMRMAVCGGASLGKRLLADADDLGIPLVHSYGMTEASPLVLVGQVKDGLEPTAERRAKQGYGVPGLDYRVCDEEGHDVPRNGVSCGELLLRGPWIVDEYLRDKARTQTAFVDGWYHTGDIVTVDSAGYMQVVDRKADLIKSGGEWISSLDLESALMAHPAVQMAAVVGVPDDRWQERPRAFVVCSEAVSEAELRAYLSPQFPRFWMPDEFIFVNSIPLTTVGKVDKNALRTLT
jgi:fatty-acyl-CoA synthase